MGATPFIKNGEGRNFNFFDSNSKVVPLMEFDSEIHHQQKSELSENYSCH